MDALLHQVLAGLATGEETDPEIFEPLRGGGCLGNESFRQERLRQAQTATASFRPHYPWRKCKMKK